MPPLLRRIYQEVADGGIGAGPRLLSTGAIGSTYHELRSEPPSETDQEWPEGLVPLADRGDGYDCLDVRSGRMMAVDYEELEQGGEAVWGLAVRELAPSLEAWLEAWA